jgi:hypothetical protein
VKRKQNCVQVTPVSELHELWQPVLLPGATVGICQ